MGTMRSDNLMAALSSLSSEEAELLSQIRYLSDRLETVQRVVKLLSKLVQTEKVGTEMPS
jgi:hypothetical protein